MSANEAKRLAKEYGLENYHIRDRQKRIQVLKQIYEDSKSIPEVKRRYLEIFIEFHSGDILYQDVKDLEPIYRGRF
jgi:hypothetical protein